MTAARGSISRAFFGGLALCLWGVSCRGSTGETWIRLAEGHEPALHVAGELLFDDGAGRRYVADRGYGVWVERRVEATDWFEGPLPGSYGVRRTIGQIGVPDGAGSPTRLWIGEAESRWVDPDRASTNLDELEPGDFSSLGDTVVAYVGVDAEPPGPGRVATYVSLGHDDAGTWTARLIGASGSGMVLLPGLAEELPTLGAEGGVLRFGFAAQRFGSSDGAVVLQVDLGDVPLGRFEVESHQRAQVERLSVELPKLRGDERLRFRMEAEGAIGAVFEPRIGPGEPAERDRRDVVVFLADTFRADNLSAYRDAPGGPPVPLTPVLDGFLAESTWYRRAWAPSSWTLPSHASLFASLWPSQHGAGWEAFQLSSDAVTLAEVLRERGYRTFAVTDGGFCSESLGLAQGFDLWLEGERDLDRTRAAFDRFAKADDGRPRFVFLQTYRTHEPYLVGTGVRSELSGLGLELGADHETATEAMHAAFGAWKTGGEEAGDRSVLEQRAAALAGLYYGTVRELDTEFAGWLQAFDEAGLGDGEDVLVFTSDHGEELLDHDFFGHWNGVWEEQTRVPLVVRRPGSPVGCIEEPVSLVDLAPGILGWLGLESPSDWVGRSLEPGPEGARTQHLVGRQLPDGPTARVRGDHKLVRLPVKERLVLFDLADDPGERNGHELSFEEPDLRGRLAELGAPASLADPSPELRFDLADPRVLDRRQLQRLQELGYAEALRSAEK